MSDEKDKKNDNPHGLSVDEMNVLHHWQKGMSMLDAYKHVMLSPYDQQAIKDAALKKRVQRFFSTFRMKEAMADSPGKRGEKARQDFEKWKAQQKINAIRTFAPEAIPNDPEKIVVRKIRVTEKTPKQDCADNVPNAGNVLEEENTEPVQNAETTSTSEIIETDEIEVVEIKQDKPKDTTSKFFDKMVKPYISSGQNEQNETSKEMVLSYKEQWVRSLSNYGGDPTAVSIYGTGQYLFYTAVREMMDRREAITKGKISVLDKDGRGSVLTPNIISALKTGAAMVMPFAPAPTADQRKSMQNMAALFAALPDIEEDPDAYTAPIPNTIDVEAETNDGTNQ